MTPVEFEMIVARTRAQTTQLRAQLMNTESEVEKAAIQAKIDAVVIEFRRAQVASLGKRPEPEKS